MEEVGAQVASPIFIHPSLTGRFYDAHPVAKKRNLPFQPASFPHQNPSDNWNPMSWDWDSARFVARPLQSDVVRGGNATPVQLKVSSQKVEQTNMADHKKPVPVEDNNDNENLRLKLGGEGDGRNGVLTLLEEPQPVARPNKRVRSGSPGGASYPMCQVDNCKKDLSTAKDYHRRHKVCEVHSKASKVLVGEQMQRFCQQCSRFHPLSEFDEGKRSCRRRLAGHNRRRRKTQPDDATSRLLVPENHEKSGNSDLDIVNLLTVLAHAQGNTEDRSSKFSSIPDNDQLIQLLDKINSLKPLPAKLPGSSNGSIPNLVSSGNQSRLNGNVSLPPTVDLRAVLLENPAAPSSGVVEIQSQPSSDGSDSEKSKSAFVDQATYLNLQKGPALEFPSVGGESSTSNHSPVADSDCHAQETRPNLLLQLFNSSPENDSLRKLPSGRNYFSSDSSNPSQVRSPSSSQPVVHDLFPMHTSREPLKHGTVSTSEVDTMYVKATTSNQCSTSLKLFGASTRAAENGSIQSSPYQAGYTSSTGSDHSPSSLNSGVQDRNGRIVFKLFDKDPSHLPESLRAQIYNWLANSPSEIESYIRPGCIVLSVYLSMSTYAWDQLEGNLRDYVKSLVNDINTDFWRNGRFLVHTDKQMASYKDGKIHLSKSWRALNNPELVLVSPVAVVGGHDTSLLLRGINLTIPGTKIHCTHTTGGYSIKESPALACQETVYDEIRLGSFKIHAPSSVIDRCFIEVENGLRGTSFPVIIADSTICQELRLLESVINEGAELHDGSSSDHIQNPVTPRTREEVLHFLDELGWLFQRKKNSSLFESPDYRLSRFKFLLTFSVEHDFCSLIKTLLDILQEINLGREGLAGESLETLSESHLLNRAVNRRCRRMVDLLIHYSISDYIDSSIKYIFVPNMAGPGGITPLHLAASTLGSDDMVDALTSDPQEIGLHSWKSVLDANGLSPYAYALMRNHHSYNTLVAQKLADKKNFQVSVSIGNEIEQVDHGHKTTFHIRRGRKSCSKCAAAQGRYIVKFPGSQGLLQRPYIHSMLAVAAVCVCVCLFFRGAPDIGSIAPFKWENLGYGSF